MDMPIVDSPGMSIVAIDPGGTTGVAVWDAWDGQLYVDQIDAGRGRRVREHVPRGVTQSTARKRAVKATGGSAGAGKSSEIKVLNYIEAGVVTCLLDIVLAAGPMTAVVIEDYVLGWGDPGKVKSTKREGLSPVRIATRMDDRLERDGYLNGDVWRDWDGFGAHGADGRGVKVVKGRGVMSFPLRLQDAVRWRLGDPVLPHVGAERALWAGGGVKWVWQMPGQRLWLPGGERAVVAWLKEHDYWMPGAPHGMDALMHMLVFARRLGAGIPANQKRIWNGRFETP
jgi:hypothetical protein